jgi:hypothetical protein
LGRSKTGEGLAYRPLPAPWAEAGELFRFAGAWVPPGSELEAGWGAWEGTVLVAALLVERGGGAVFLHGPVVVAPPAFEPEGAVETAARLVALALEHAESRGVETVFTRPQGLDRVWVRAGFIPVPEVALPPALRGRPGAGLFAWRGGSALWSAAGRGPTRESRPR